jgi:hypothetical protein
MARKKVAKKSTARKKNKASDSDEEAAKKARRRARLDDVSFDDNGETRESAAAARASDRRRAVAAARPTANFVRNNNERRRTRLDDVSFDDDGKTRDSSAAHARAIAAKPRKSEDSQDFELVGVQTAEERAEANRQRAEQEGDVLEVDDDASDAPPPVGYVCVLKSDGADGERVPLHETLKFGRALDNDVRIPVARCSRLHAELTVDGRATLQNHARAANTTVLRGETLEPKEARDVNSGDVFEICGRRFRFEAAVAPAPAPAPSPQQAVDVDLTGAPDSDDEEEPEFSPPESAPQDSDIDYEEESDESEEEEESDDDSPVNDVCYRCGGRGHWASDCGEPYSYYGYGRY